MNLRSLFALCVLLAACSSPSSKTDNETLLSGRDSVSSSVQMITEEKAGSQLPLPDTAAIVFSSVRVEHPRGDTFDLFVPQGFTVRIAAYGMNRIRFMDRSPDGRLFLTDMINLADNTKGKVYVLNDSADSLISEKVTYLSDLRNPNSLAFHTDKAGKEWLYLALTDKLVRYPYESGSVHPASAPEILDTYPDYGLSYRYGGWHLTRTIQFGDNGKLYVSVGSSCNVCVEKETIRAVIVEMNDDGSNKRVFAKGLRNAVGLEWVNGKLFATNMAADHLGKDVPDDAMFEVEDGKHYGWPYCYHSNGRAYADPMFDTASFKISPAEVPDAYSYFGAHTAPLGLAWFGDEEASDPSLKNYFLVAQHGSYTPAIGRGYSLQRIRKNHQPEDFVKGFLDANGKIHGRPCGIMPAGRDQFYFTDDKFGTLYFVYR